MTAVHNVPFAGEEVGIKCTYSRPESSRIVRRGYARKFGKFENLYWIP
jgi:hypothetical protein